jgi:predicted aminopeptidase
MRRLAAPMAALLLSGCSTMSFYWQAFSGQMEVTRLARPLEEVIADPATAAELKRRLAHAQRARAFASAALGLPDNESYRRYADLKRRYVVWNVFAAPGLSLELQTQCYPVAGCVVYRGFFDEAAARNHAARLREAGLDVHVGGVPAYSTLGWFADPLLSTFIRYPDLEITRLIFHELAHQVAYVRDDSTFNESFAVAVEEEGLRRWLAAHPGEDDASAQAAYTARRRALLKLFVVARHALAAVYDGPGDEASRRAGKARVLERLGADYRLLRAQWQLGEAEARAWDEWALTDLNNAKLGSIATYTQRVPQFAALLAQGGGDLPKLYAGVRELAALPKEERIRRLDALAPIAKED